MWSRELVPCTLLALQVQHSKEDLMSAFRSSILLSALLVVLGKPLSAATLTFEFVEIGTGAIAANLVLNEPAPFTYSNVELLTFTQYGASQLTSRVLQSQPLLADYGYSVPAGPFTGTFNDNPNGSVIVDATGNGLMGSGGQFATIFGDAPLPRPFIGATLRLNFGVPNNSVLAWDEIRIIPSGANGGVIEGEWRLVPEPSTFATASIATGVVVLCRRRKYPCHLPVARS